MSSRRWRDVLRGRLLAAAAGVAERVRQTTPGQYWTSALALLVAVPVMLFGMPPRTTVVEATPEQVEPPANPPIALPPDDPPTDAGILTGPPPPARGAAPRPVLPEVPAPGPRLGGPSGSPSEPAPAPPVRRPGVVLLAAAGTGPPGHSDADIAAAMAATSAFSFQVVEGDLGSDDLCGQVGTAGSLVLTSLGMSAALRDCLLAAGMHIVGYDDLGSATPAAGPVALSTAHGARRALLDLAAWAAGAGAPGQTVGLVGSEALQPVLEPALPEVAQAGLTVAETAWLAPDTTADAAINQAVADFAQAGVDTVVFATNTDVQRRWLSRSSLLLPGATYLVLDTADSVLDEFYPPSFDGATALAAVEFPWVGRSDQGLSEEQSACQETWEAAAGVVLSDTEMARAMLWCQHLAIVETVLGAVASGTSLHDALVELTADSLVTTPLGPLDDNGWGPAAVRELQWHAACGCWEPTT